jgi:hypothetical protein
MPGFVDKVSVAGNRIDFAPNGFKIIVFVCQILQLGGAYKGEVRRVEEKNAPLAENIGFSYGFEHLVMKRLHGKIANFFLNHRHNTASLAV